MHPFSFSLEDLDKYSGHNFRPVVMWADEVDRPVFLPLQWLLYGITRKNAINNIPYARSGRESDQD